METVNNLTSAASRAIWGDPDKTTETGEEPVSGEKGDVSAGEPYDKGNVEPTSISESTNQTIPSAIDRKETSGDLPADSKDETSLSGPTSSSIGTTAEGSNERSRIEAKKEDAEDASKVDASDPSPKSLSELKGNGGTAGGREEEAGLQRETQGEGTGEKYVKSTGVKADGGDFDAANAGAGKEADRLLQTKGVHHETPGSQSVEPTGPTSKNDSKDTKELGGKMSLKDKIKSKLHKNKNS